jgi:DNA-binding transcriptional MerR regulator
MSTTVFSEAFTLTLVTSPAAYSIDTAARLVGVRPELLRHYCKLGLLGEAFARTGAEPIFDDDAIYELRRFEHFRRHHGLNRKTVRLICDLWHEVERLQMELRFLRRP